MTTPAPTRYDVIVIGAGIAGVCAALSLQSRGAKVALIDEAQPGSGASFGNAGIVVNTNLRPVFAGMTPAVLLGMLRNPASPLNVRWSRFPAMVPWFLKMLSHAGPAEVDRITKALASLCQPGAGLYEEMWQAAGAGDLVEAKGNIALNLSEAERDAHWEKLGQLRAMGVGMEKLDRADLARLVPTVSDRYTHGIYSPAYKHALDPQLLITRMVDLFLSQKGEWINARVLDITTEGGRVTGVRTPGATVAGDRVVVAAGTASAGLAKRMGEPVPHQAVGGYHVMIRNPGVTLDRPILPIDFRFAITPMGDAIRLAGIYEFGGEGMPFRTDLINNMLSHITRVLPGIRTSDTSMWRGFRSYLPDGLPIISASSRTEGLFYLFGFSSSGMINGATAGKAMAALATGAQPDIDLAPFALKRFIKGGR
tara:strand:- start:23302 stop:24573 length:1272 start_codon:yes stop_codon:yes gene_type:complete